MKWWRGDYVIVFPERVKFHKCVVCGRKLDFNVDSSDRGVGPECARKAPEIVEKARAAALEHDRRRYRAEVLNLGFKIGS